MFSVLFEVNPRKAMWDDYLGNAGMLRPELEQIDGFVENVRYRSLTRDGWILSLSSWRDEKSVVRWRTRARHHDVQNDGRERILQDYHLRVGQYTYDTHIPSGYELLEQRLDETEVGQGTSVTLINASRPSDLAETTNAADCAEYLGLNPYGPGMLSWDLFDSVLSPGNLILMQTWSDRAAADSFVGSIFNLPSDARVRQVRVIRDYGMYDRREAPQYYPDAPDQPTLHS
jgi:heme-degrading monooxygenase HmoA